MKVFTVNGITGSGKTTTIEHIIGELRRRGYTVGSVKDIHFEAFTIDTEGTNTYRHRGAGADIVTARGTTETDVLIPRRLPVRDILSFYDHDWVVLEGVDDFPVPVVLCAHTPEECRDRMTGSVIAVSGIAASSTDSCCGVPAIDATSRTRELVDLLESRVFAVLPGVEPECCSACGRSCAGMVEALVRGEAQRSECALDRFGVSLKVGGREISMVPFVQEVIRRTVGGLISTLDGYRPGETIEISIMPRKDGAR